MRAHDHDKLMTESSAGADAAVQAAWTQNIHAHSAACCVIPYYTDVASTHAAKISQMLATHPDGNSRLGKQVTPYLSSAQMHRLCSPLKKTDCTLRWNYVCCKAVWKPDCIWADVCCLTERHHLQNGNQEIC
jgi:hypothetical protein